MTLGMMDDQMISTSKVATWGLWVVVLILILATWLTAFVGPWRIAALLGFTAGVVAPIAAVAHIRIYSVSVCGQLRIVRGHLEVDNDYVRRLR